MEGRCDPAIQLSCQAWVACALIKQILSPGLSGRNTPAEQRRSLLEDGVITTVAHLEDLPRSSPVLRALLEMVGAC